jgi:predicted Zn-dependent protease
MQVLEHPNCFFVNAAHGWLELGNPKEAAAELEQIPPDLREHPDVLQVRWEIALKRQGWSEALAIAESLCHLAPENPFGWIHRSFCLHELKRTREAWDLLLPVVDRFPKEWLFCYNLACYACQLGWVDQAREWLARAREIGERSEIDQLAAADKDLRPLFQKPMPS